MTFVNLNTIPQAETIHMIAGWRQWADAGSISSGLPQYLIQHLNAEKIGEIDSDSFYLFQFPGTHHLLRPMIRLENGYRQSLDTHQNEFYYAEVGNVGLVIFLGDEPHINVRGYADAFLQAAQQLNVHTTIALGGVYGSMPYDRERRLSCIYSLHQMHAELEDYAVNFSDYEGGVTIGAYLTSQAEYENVRMIDCYAFVPAYDFSQEGMQPQGFQLDNDFKAWYDLLRRFNHMLDLEIDLSDLEDRSRELVDTLDDKVSEMEQEMPQLNIRDYFAQLEEDFTERAFAPLDDDVWGAELSDLFSDSDD